MAADTRERKAKMKERREQQKSGKTCGPKTGKAKSLRK